MVLNEINHKMPIYRDCTLGEVLLVGSMVLAVIVLLLSLITKLIFGRGAIGLVAGPFVFVPITKAALAQLQKIKYGKPYAYYKHWAIKKLMQHGLYKNLFITQQQKWSVAKDNT